MITSTFNNQLNILETQFKDVISLEDLADYIDGFSKNTDYPRTLRILTDATTASFDFTVSDLNAINAEKDKSLVDYHNSKDAIIIDSPETAAISVIYEALAQNETYQFKVFSTKDAALRWLNTF